MPSEYFDELTDQAYELASFQLHYGSGQLKLVTEPADAKISVIMIEYLEWANPHFDQLGFASSMESSSFNNYLDGIGEEEGTQDNLQDQWQQWANSQSNPNVAVAGPRKFIIVNFDINGFNKSPASFCNYTTNQSAFITAVTAVSWLGTVVQGQIVRIGVQPEPDHPVQPMSSDGSGKNKNMIKNDNYTISSEGAGLNIEDDAEIFDKKNKKEKREKGDTRRNSNNYNHTKAEVKNGNELLKKLRYITKGGKRIIKRVSPASPQKIVLPPKPKTIHNPPIAEQYGSGNNDKTPINDEGSQ